MAPAPGVALVPIDLALVLALAQAPALALSSSSSSGIDATGMELECGNEHCRPAVSVCGERRMGARAVIRRLWKVVLKHIQIWGV